METLTLFRAYKSTVSRRASALRACVRRQGILVEEDPLVRIYRRRARLARKLALVLEERLGHEFGDG